MNILRAINDNKVFAKHFRGETWSAWIAFLAALFALPMIPDQLAIYQKHTGRTNPPTSAHREAWLCIGRRGGKSFILAVIAVFLACFFDWRPYLGPGEVGTIMIVCADRRQARTILRFALGLLKATPMLKRQVVNVTRESITLVCDIQIEVHTASFRSTRGYSIVAALLDEIAFWPTDETASEPDSEIVNAIKPSMATIPNSMLLCASSPYAKRGTLWSAYKNHFGQDGDPVLVWQAATRDMNPSVPQAFIDQHMAEDEAKAKAEYLGTFREDLEQFVSREAVMQCIAPLVFERVKMAYRTYYAFVDPSGGSSDSMTLAIGHRNIAERTVTIDCLREAKPPFSPEAVCQEFALVCKSYGCLKVVGDRYGGIWPKEMFSKHGVQFEQSALPKSDLFIAFLALLNSKRVELLDNMKMINQLVGLERRVFRSGKDSIDHAPGAHDDLANVVAGVASLCNQYGGYDSQYSAWSDDPLVNGDAAPPPEQQREPVRTNGDWWRSQPQYQHQQQPSSSADAALQRLYGGIDFATRFGGPLR
jgi:hypothetical protein